MCEDCYWNIIETVSDPLDGVTVEELLEELTQRYADMDRYAKSLPTQVEADTEAYQKLQAAFDAKVREMQEVFPPLKEENSRLKAELRDLHAVEADLRAQVAEAESVVKTYKEQVNWLTSIKDEQRYAIGELELELARVNDCAETNTEALERELGEAKALIMCLQGEVVKSVYTDTDYPPEANWQRGWTYDVMKDVIFSD